MSNRELERARENIRSWHLGKTSARYETGGRGASTISTGKGDHGGVSYGAYQLSLNAGTLDSYLKTSRFRDAFAGLAPGTQKFNERWRALALAEPGFGAEQHDFIERTHYAVELARLKEVGIDLSGRGRGVHDALWSTSVQFGPGTRNIFRKGLQERFGFDYRLEDLSDQAIIEAVQDYKLEHNSSLFKRSPANWPGLLRRAKEEKQDLLELSDHEQLLQRHGELPGWAKPVPMVPPGAPSRAPKSASHTNVRASDNGMDPTPTCAPADIPSNCDAVTLERIHSWVRGTGQWNEIESFNVAAAAYRAYEVDPLLRRVDHVTGGMGRDGAQNVFVVYAPFGDREPRFVAAVDGREARDQDAQLNLSQASHSVDERQRLSEILDLEVGRHESMRQRSA